jgi:DNA polymerase-3 subunit delta
MKNITVYYGADTFFIKNKIKQNIQVLGLDEFNVTHYDCEEDLLENALADAATVPFMSDHKMVVIHNAYFLAPKSSLKLQHHLPALKQYLEHPVSETYLILTVPEQSLDKKQALVKKLLEVAEVIEAKKQTAEDLGAWIRRQLSKNGLSIDADAFTELLRRVGFNSEVAFLEVRKLLLYAQDLNHISKGIIEEVITRNVEDNVFEILNAIHRQDKAFALKLYQDLVVQGEDPLRILALMIRQYREMRTTLSLVQEGADETRVQHHFNVSRGRAFFMLKNVQHTHFSKVDEQLRYLQSLDEKIKTGQVDKKLAAELFILAT